MGATVLGTTTASEAVVSPPSFGSPIPSVNHKTPVPNAIQLHYLNRLGMGFCPSSFQQIRNAKSPDSWLRRQLSPESITEAPLVNELPEWFPDSFEIPASKWEKNCTHAKLGWQYAVELGNITLLRRIYSRREVFENLVGLWSEHLHVNAGHATAWVHRKSYDDTIREHALGKFSDMLVACELHPAMLLYLDNWLSVDGAPNENQGRELLELHTVGNGVNYTEAMVKDSAKILSGYTVDAYKSWEGYYDPNRHTTGSVQVLGFTDRNARSDGRQVAVEYLSYLAHHPATAHNVAAKLCRHFVADNPSESIVDAVAKAFRDSGTDIRTSLRALVQHADFNTSAGRLVRNPIEDFVATCRVLEVRPKQPRAENSFARSCVFAPKIPLVHQWPTPEGLPLGNLWLSPNRLLNSFYVHWNLAGGWWGPNDVDYRSPVSWLPASRLSLAHYVDHLSRLWLGRRSTSRILAAVVEATGLAEGTEITSQKVSSSWLFVRTAAVFLDSPEHVLR